LKGNLPSKGRCPKCTLKPPCKHFSSQEELQNIVKTPNLKQSVLSNNDPYLEDQLPLKQGRTGSESMP